jgi:hypothetical protein
MAESQPTAPKFTRTDIYSLNAIKSQFLGEGGGQEVDNAEFLSSLRAKMGAKTGDQAFEDLRARNDPEATVTTSKKYPNQTSVSVSKPAGLVRLKQGSFKNSFVKLPGAKAAKASAASVGKRQLASNIMVVSGQHSATGKPLFVGGPQIGFNYPGLTMEMQLKSPNINVRGDLRPVPGVHAHRPRRRLRLVADLSGRRHHRHLRRAALRRLEGQVLLQGQVPEDGEGRRRHDHQGRLDDQGHVLPHRPRPGDRLRQG